MNRVTSSQDPINQKPCVSPMYQVIPFRPLLIAAAWLTLVGVAVLSWAETKGVGIPFRYVVVALNVLILALTWRPIWRWIWSIFPFLRQWFPDLNGTYEVELQHNWPIQQKLLAAACGIGDNFDPRLPDTEMPELGSSKLKATIDVTFLGVKVLMWSERTTEGGVIIDRSRTLSATLVRPCDGHPHRLVYTYQQVNRRERVAPSDDIAFEGAAILNIEDVESGGLRGQYWTNRAWHRGFSTAGNIVFRRISIDILTPSEARSMDQAQPSATASAALQSQP